MGAINAGFRSNLIILDGTLTARRYIDGILNPVLLPLLRRQRQNQNLIFQQDNACPHSARVTQDFLRQNGVNVVDWPAVSPDMNPISHMWDELGRRVRERPNPTPEPARTWPGSSTRMAKHSKKDCETFNKVNEATSTCRD